MPTDIDEQNNLILDALEDLGLLNQDYDRFDLKSVKVIINLAEHKKPEIYLGYDILKLKDSK